MLSARTIRELVIAACLIGAIPLLAPAPAQVIASSKKLQPLKLNHFVGMTVENGDGQNLGKVRDFIVDLRTGHLQFALLASGGFAGFGAKLRAVPPEILSAGTTKRNTVAIEATK